ncbi:hypothetical protein [Longispora albida]|uniref:hypothetical protein n=1 Tax=Longispora albida TaxID=203523 RepID=UPI0003804297|nr:hypothetical protein [Longispora albida]
MTHDPAPGTAAPGLETVTPGQAAHLRAADLISSLTTVGLVTRPIWAVCSLSFSGALLGPAHALVLTAIEGSPVWVSLLVLPLSEGLLGLVLAFTLFRLATRLRRADPWAIRPARHLVTFVIANVAFYLAGILTAGAMALITWKKEYAWVLLLALPIATETAILVLSLQARRALAPLLRG